MKRLVLVWLALAVVGSAAVAQGVSPTFRHGTKSLNFTFGGFGGFGLTGTGPSGGVGLSYFLSPDAAVRVGLQVMDYNRTLTFNGGGGATGTDGSESGTSVGVTVDYLKYVHAGSSRVRPYLGGGVGVSQISNSTTTAVPTGTTATQIKNAPAGISAGFAAPGLNMGVHANLGAEFFLFNEVSIAGEYALNVINRSSPADQQTITGGATVTTKGNPSTMFLGFGSVGATVRIYF